MVCVQVKSVEAVESAGHEGCWATLKTSDYTDARRRTGVMVADCAGLVVSWLLVLVRNGWI